jgi:hypothetical protein
MTFIICSETVLSPVTARSKVAYRCEQLTMAVLLNDYHHLRLLQVHRLQRKWRIVWKILGFQLQAITND